MDDLLELSLGASDNAAAPYVLAGLAQALPAVGMLSLRQFVEQAVAAAESRAIGRALTMAKGNKSLAARILQTNYTTLHTKMRRFKISAQDFRRS